MGRLPAVIGGGPATPEMEQAGKATCPPGIDGLPKQGKLCGARGPYSDTGPFYLRCFEGR